MTVIGDHAFDGCKCLERVKIPDNVTTIGNSAFANCIVLIKIVIGKNVTVIKDFAFKGCVSLVTIINKSDLAIVSGSDDNGGVGKYATEIKSNESEPIENFTFKQENGEWYLTGYNGKNENLVLPSSYNGEPYGIYKNAFYNKKNLKSVTIPNKVVSVGDSAFAYCDELTKVIWNAENCVEVGSFSYSSLYEIYFNCTIFEGCSKLANITIGESVKTIPAYAFYGCSGLTGITVPDKVTNIGESAFAYCGGLTSVTIGKGVASIGDGAFYGCYKLVEVINNCGLNIVKGHEENGYVGRYALDVKRGGATSIVHKDKFLFYTSVGVNYLLGYTGNETKLILPHNYNGQDYIIYSRAFYGYSKLTDVVLSNSVKMVGDYAFYHCIRLTSITIPNSVTSIGLDAFFDCNKLVEVINNSNLNIAKGSRENGYIGSYALNVKKGGTTEIVNKDNYLFYTSDNVNYLLGYVGNEIELTLPIDYNGQNYEIYQYAFSDCGELTSVTIPDSVTSIGDCAFEDCCGLTGITIPDSVTSIGSSAFRGCGGLTSVTIGRNVATMSESAFIFCTEITSVVWNAEDCLVSEHFSRRLFENCFELTSVIIGENVKTIPVGVFYDCIGLTSVTWNAENCTNLSVDNIFDGCYRLATVTIGENVKTIPRYAFENCSGLTSITIPDGVTSIGEWAFGGCDKLVEVINNSNLNIVKGSAGNGYIGYYALNIKKGGTTEIVNKGDYLFYTSDDVNYLLGYVGNDTELILPNDYNGQNYQIYNYAFYRCNELTEVSIPDCVTSIGRFAFGDCDRLTSIVIPIGITDIGGSAFYDCDGLTSVIWNAENCAKAGLFTPYSQPIFEYCGKLTEVIFGENVKTIPDYAFFNCRELTSVTIGNSVKSIGDDAFSNCSRLLNIIVADGNTEYYSKGNCLIEIATKTLILGCLNSIIPDDGSIIRIRGGAFNGCSGLKSITIPDSVTSIEKGAFCNCSGLTSITIPDKVTTIGWDAFRGCSGLTSITIPDSVTSIGDSAFEGCSRLTNICITDISKWCKISGLHNLMKYGSGNKRLYLNGKLVTDLVIPDSVTSIGDYVFSGCKGLKSVTIPDSVTSIGDYVFSGCNRLTSITIPDSVTSIGEYAFYNCNGLTSITIPNKVTSIGWDAFFDCNKLVEVINNSNLNIAKGSRENGYIGSYALNVKKGGTTEIVNKDNYLFYTSDNVNYLLGYIGNEIELTLPIDYNGQNYEIYKYAFYNCSGLTNITIPDKVTGIGRYAFYDCSRLTSVTIGNSVSSIGSNAFYGCKKLVEVINNSSLNIIKRSEGNGYIGYYALNIKKGGTTDIVNKNDYLFFTNDNNINYLLGYVGNDTELILPNDYNGQNYQIYNCAFRCNELTSVTIPDSVTSIGWDAFYNCNGLTSITIPDSVTYIGSDAFEYCNGLTSIEFKGTKKQWNAISKGLNWNRDTGNYTIHCTDGDIEK